MFPLAHLGIPLFIADIAGHITSSSSMDRANSDLMSSKWSGKQFDLFPAVLGCLFPDIIDKLIGQMLFSSGRAIGHTLVFCAVSGIIFSLVRSKRAGSSFFLANFSHLILDAPGVPWFWPISPTEFKETKNALKTLELLFKPLTLSFELLGLGLLVILGFRYRLEINIWINEEYSQMMTIIQILPSRD
ncbi:MAG: metal-dependent hydrolase [Candidatus Heimdallarchaeota archaeon]